MKPDRRHDDRDWARVSWRAGGILAMLVGVACLLLQGPFLVHTAGYAERLLSLDGHVTAEGLAFMRHRLVVAGILLLAMGVVVATLAAAFSKGASRLVALYRQLTGSRYSAALLWSSLVTGVLLAVCWFRRGHPALQPLYVEDQFFEMSTAILFFVSGVLLVIAACFHWRNAAQHRKVVSALIAGMAVVFLFLGMEEISWGQRLFGWETPALLERVNEQGELNIHNLSIEVLYSLYRWGALAFTLACAAGWLWLSRFKVAALRFLVPHVAMVPLVALVFIFGTLWMTGEFLEQLGAVFALLYACTALRTSRLREPA